MTLSDIKNHLQEQLKNDYSKREIDTFFFWACDRFYQIQKIDYLIHEKQKELSEQELKKWEDLTIALHKHQPIQYYFQVAYFYGLSFYVDENVLIPRPETEELVQKALQLIEHKNIETLLDIGTGSGCIPIALAKNTSNCAIAACDISKSALAIAQKNAFDLNVKIDFFHCDILTTALKKKYDLIISNPPYIPYQDIAHIAKNVCQYEPHLALFVPQEKPFLFYERIMDLAFDSLHQKGLLLFEIHENFGNKLLEIAEKKGFFAQLEQDLQGKDRILTCSLLH